MRAAASRRFFACAAVVLLLGGSATDAAKKPGTLPLETFWGGAPPRPFDFALVLGGGGYDVFAHFGIVDAARDLGLEPDLLIAPCGTSIVAAVLNAVPDPEERLRLIFSPEFHRVMRAPERQKLTPAMLSMVFSIWGRSWGLNDRVPRLYDFPVVEFEEGFRPARLDSDFHSGNPRLIIVATRTDVLPEDRGEKRDGRKLFQEIFFTDADTARHLAGFEAPVAHYFPHSFYMSETAARTDAPVFDAVRASISDMYFVEPYEYRGERYVTGGFDLHLEVAQGLARHVAATLIRGYDPLLSDAAVESVLGYRLNQRLRLSTALEVDWWIDITDKHAWGEMKFKILDGVPEDYDDFVLLAHEQYAMGYCRGVEGLTQEQPGEMRHLRALTDRNATADLQKRVRRARRSDGNARMALCDADDDRVAGRFEWLEARREPASGATARDDRGADPARD